VNATYNPIYHHAAVPASNLGIVVVIPCHDEPTLLDSLASLRNCITPNSNTEVIVIINCSENATKHLIAQNEITFELANEFAKRNSDNVIRFHIFNIQFPDKTAGVGLARKVGMDEAASRFKSIDKNGIIVCFDADSQCEANYLVEIEKAFEQNPKAPGASIYFEHPLQGSEFTAEVYDGIVNYELFLRYYCNGLRYAEHPFAFQTIGSSMAVKSKIYQAQGGMNKRKAGEDFYFLEKVIPLGNFIEINTTSVIPSPRPSHRVPFGTGKAISNWLLSKSDLCYNPMIFDDLKLVFSSVDEIYRSKNKGETYHELPHSFRQFVNEHTFNDAMVELLTNTNSLATFSIRFFKWFNLFACLKYAHFCRDNIYPQVPIYQAASALFASIGIKSVPAEPRALLNVFRTYDKNRSA